MYSVVLLTLFPDQLKSFILKGIFLKAHQQNLFKFNIIDLRDFGVGIHKKVDDYPVSERKGMLIRPDVILNALSTLDDLGQYRILYTCPKGKIFNQGFAKNLVNEKKGIVIIPGYYRGIDDRIFDFVNIERVSIGNYILNSGDVPALAIIDSVVRLIPGVLGNSDCIGLDTFNSKWFESSQYTKPDVINGKSIPDILKSGHHGEIETFKFQQSVLTTLFNRPDLISGHIFTNEEQQKITESVCSIL
jgi:tRNA (guanine37-N1)-methyltransferase